MEAPDAWEALVDIVGDTLEIELDGDDENAEYAEQTKQLLNWLRNNRQRFDLPPRVWHKGSLPFGVYYDAYHGSPSDCLFGIARVADNLLGTTWMDKARALNDECNTKEAVDDTNTDYMAAFEELNGQILAALNEAFDDPDARWDWDGDLFYQSNEWWTANQGA